MGTSWHPSLRGSFAPSKLWTQHRGPQLRGNPVPAAFKSEPPRSADTSATFFAARSKKRKLVLQATNHEDLPADVHPPCLQGTAPLSNTASAAEWSSTASTAMPAAPSEALESPSSAPAEQGITGAPSSRATSTTSPLLQARPTAVAGVTAAAGAGPEDRQQVEQPTAAAPVMAAEGKAAAAAVAGAGAEGVSEVDAGLVAFANLIGNKRFTCTQCGKCCTGDGQVWVSEDEVSRIASYLNMPEPRFLQAYAQKYTKRKGWYLLKDVYNSSSKDRVCTFLRPDNTCSIHSVRPLQCSTYPWWPELMNEKDWQWEKDRVGLKEQHLRGRQEERWQWHFFERMFVRVLTTLKRPALTWWLQQHSYEQLQPRACSRCWQQVLHQGRSRRQQQAHASGSSSSSSSMGSGEGTSATRADSVSSEEDSSSRSFGGHGEASSSIDKPGQPGVGRQAAEGTGGLLGQNAEAAGGASSRSWVQRLQSLHDVL